jgi:hypothetical protein
MHSSWIKGHKNTAARRKQVAGYRPALTDLKEIIERDFKKKEAVRDYSPGWEFKQIAVNEYNQALDDIMKLLELKDNT